MAEFKVNVSVVDEFDDPYDFQTSDSIIIHLHGDNITIDTVVPGYGNSSGSINLNNIPVGDYSIGIEKEGFAGDKFDFRISYENGELLKTDLSDQAVTQLDEVTSLFHLNLAQVSNLDPGNIEYVSTSDHVYFSSDLPAAMNPLPYYRIFVNKGIDVSPDNYLHTIAFWPNEPSNISISKSSLSLAGIATGDTISIVAHGDNYGSFQLDNAGDFPCLSNEATNVLTFKLE